MTNAKLELQETLKSTAKIKAALIHRVNYYGGTDERSTFTLKTNHSTQKLNKFFESLNFDYDAGYGDQELFGTVWLEDGTWLSRGEYDGSEWWEHNVLPEIPKRINQLKNSTMKTEKEYRKAFPNKTDDQIIFALGNEVKSKVETIHELLKEVDELKKQKANFDSILTQEEIDAPKYTDWSNETLGRCARHISYKVGAMDEKGFKGMMTTGAAFLLIRTAIDVNASELKQAAFGFTVHNEPHGDWEVIVRKKKSKSTKTK